MNWRPDNLLIEGFGKAMPFLCWAFLIVGLAGAIGTAAGWLPPFGDKWWERVTTALLWVLLAKEGYDPLAEQRAEAAAQ